jgi:hypothetical protein
MAETPETQLVKNEEPSVPFSYTKTELKAASKAARSQDIEEIQKALEVIRSAANNRKELAHLEEHCKDDWSPARTPVRRAMRWVRDHFGPNVAAFAALATAVALVAQVWVAQSTAKSQSASQEDTQWQAAMKNVKSDGSDALMGAFVMESFFKSARYGQNSRAVAATLLPSVEQATGFDEVFFGLSREICGQANNGCAPDPARDQDIEGEMLGIGRQVAYYADDLFGDMQGIYCPGSRCGPKGFRKWVEDPNPEGKTAANEKNDMVRALAYSWEIGSVSDAFGKIWAGKDKLMDPKSANLGGVILQGLDLSNADFSGSNLQGTRFWGTKVAGADFSQVENADGSDWEDTHWWRAKVISCPLSDYLKAHFEPKDAQIEHEPLARELERNCKPI